MGLEPKQAPDILGLTIMSTFASISHQHAVDNFVARARAVGATVTTVQDIAAAVQTIARAREAPTTSGAYIASRATLTSYPGLKDLLLAEGIQLGEAEAVSPQDAGPLQTAARLAGSVGIIAAIAAVAETGSVLPADETLPTRLLGMLADTVFVLLPAGRVLPSLDEMGEMLDRLSREGHRYLSMVTGPSRTADIERVLTIGVQGPKVLHVIVMSNER